MSDPEKKDEQSPKPGDPCVECGKNDGTQPTNDPNLVPDGKTVSMCPGCKEDRAAWHRKNRKAKPLNPGGRKDQPPPMNTRCCP